VIVKYEDEDLDLTPDRKTAAQQKWLQEQARLFEQVDYNNRRASVQSAKDRRRAEKANKRAARRAAG
jgi:hypothetical protein